MKPFCFANHRIISSAQATLHPLDIGLIRGYAIFDFFRTEDYQPFFLNDYLMRFISSAEKTGLSLDFSMEDLKGIINTLIKKNNLEQGGIRMILSGGVSDNHFSPTKGSFFIFCEDLQMPSEDKYRNGVKLIIEEYVRPMASIKTSNYTLPVWLSRGWKEKGAEDVIYHHKGKVSESSRSNIFMVKGGIISTPRTDILLGITRKNILALAGNVQERDIMIAEILQADEVFMTSTTKRILPVTQIDHTPIGTGKPGEVTLHLIQKYKDLEFQIKRDVQ